MTKSELMEAILERPLMYIGRESVITLQAFIDGFTFATLIGKQETEDILYDGFGMMRKHEIVFCREKKRVYCSVAVR